VRDGAAVSGWNEAVISGWDGAVILDWNECRFRCGNATVHEALIDVLSADCAIYGGAINGDADYARHAKRASSKTRNEFWNSLSYLH
jgi:hypothetical protein